MQKLLTVAFGLSSWSAANASVSSWSIAEITQLIIAITGLVAAVSAFVIGLKSRREDPRDRLLETLLKERKEFTNEDPPDVPRRRSEVPRRSRRREPR